MSLTLLVATAFLCASSIVPVLSNFPVTTSDSIRARGDETAREGSIGSDRAQWNSTVRRAVQYLRSQGQAADGSFSRPLGIGVSALATTALLRAGSSPDDPVVDRALKHLQSFVREDGGVYQEGTLYRNYETSLAIMCFAEANQDGRHNKLLEGASRFIKQLQWDEGEGHDPSSTSYGGLGYGKHRRPDLSNTSYFVDALEAGGVPPEDEALQKALQFISRCQNRYSRHNTTEFSTKIKDGGFYYTIAAGGQSQAGTTPNGGLRSYGSMTYAGLKSMIHAGVGSDDQRVKAAVRWIEENYSVQENPGLGDSGLYYYYHTLAKALSAAQIDQITDPAQQQPHDWRRELTRELAKRQRADGSWINHNDRWLEGDPNLVSAYALLSLMYCRPAQVSAP